MALGCHSVREPPPKDAGIDTWQFAEKSSAVGGSVYSHGDCDEAVSANPLM
jgi:hypothetical protein